MCILDIYKVHIRVSVMVDIGRSSWGVGCVSVCVCELEVQSHAAAQGQWVRGTQPEHTWRAGGIVQLTVIVPLWSP